MADTQTEDNSLSIDPAIIAKAINFDPSAYYGGGGLTVQGGAAQAQYRSQDFKPYQDFLDSLAGHLSAQSAYENSAEGMNKALERADALGAQQTKSSMSGLQARLAAMGVDPTQGRYADMMNQSALEGSKNAISYGQQAMDAQRALGLQTTSAAGSAMQNAGKFKQDLWALDNQSADIANRYAVGMAGAGAQVHAADVSAANARAQLGLSAAWKPFEYTLQNNQNAISGLNALSGWTSAGGKINNGYLVTPSGVSTGLSVSNVLSNTLKSGGLSGGSSGSSSTGTSTSSNSGV